MLLAGFRVTLHMVGLGVSSVNVLAETMYKDTAPKSVGPKGVRVLFAAAIGACFGLSYQLWAAPCETQHWETQDCRRCRCRHFHFGEIVCF